MENEFKKMNRGQVFATQGGFLQVIILIIVALFIMKYSGLTVSMVVNWFLTFFKSVLR